MKKLLIEMNKAKYLYLLMLFPAAFYLVFHYFPMYGISIAFRDFLPSKGFFRSEWVGLRNFQWLIIDGFFWRAFRNTIEISLSRIAIGFTPPIILALLFSEMRGKRYKRVLQTFYTFPHFLSWVIISGLMLNILVSDGVLNNLLSALGLPNNTLLTNGTHFRFLLYGSDIWKSVGWSSIIYLAAIAGINPEIYEAAQVDGAGRFRCMLHITIPELFPTMSVLLILSFGNVMNAGFDQIFNMYNSTVRGSAEIIDTYLFSIAFTRADYSFATAIGLFKSIINFVLLLIANQGVKLLGGRGIF